MRVHIGGDHAAFETQQALLTYLTEQGHEVINHGPSEYDAEDDYPVYVLRAAEGVRDDEGSLGIVLGGSGNGEQMAANKVKGIRAALCLTPEFASLAREHNGAQILSIGGRFVSIDEAKQIAKELRDWVAKEIGPIAKPDLIQFAPGLPKTRSGKIMRRILRKIAEDSFDNLGDTSTLADPAVVDDLIDNRQNRA